MTQVVAGLSHVSTASYQSVGQLAGLESLPID